MRESMKDKHKSIRLSHKFGLDEFVEFNNGFKICIGHIVEIRFRFEGTFYFIECPGDKYYEIGENKIERINNIQ